MLFKRSLTILSLVIAVFAILSSSIGIFSSGGQGEFQITSVRGETVTIYGEGVYKHMSSDVAIQGIAQDWITLFLAVPILLLSLYLYRQGSHRGHLMLTGTLLYFYLTYLFYLVMAMYNELFLAFVVLLSTSLFSLILALLSFDWMKGPAFFVKLIPVKFIGGFLIFNAVLIGLLWLSVVVPPLLEGTFPETLEHYTTLPVQGLDLAIFLPLSFLSGLFLIQKKAIGYIAAPVYLVFLTLIMTALSAKIIGMALTGVNAMPAIVIIPVMNLVTIGLAIYTLSAIGSIQMKKQGAAA